MRDSSSPSQSWRTEPVVLEPLRGTARTASVLIALACAGQLYLTWLYWDLSAFLDRASADPGLNDGVYLDTDRHDAVLEEAQELAVRTLLAAFLVLLTVLAAGVAYLFWLRAARENAEVLDAAGQRRDRRWLFWGWIVPGANLVIPFQFVGDIWRASRPAGSTTRMQLVVLWWLTYAATLVGSMWLQWGVADPEEATDLVDVAAITHEAANVATVTTAVECVAGLLAILVVRQITRWQAVQRRVVFD
jgi:hypothetical protein